MVSICDDLRRLDKVLLRLSQGSARNLQMYVLLTSARRRVQALEKKARALGGIDVMWCMISSSNSSGGAAPMYAHAWPQGGRVVASKVAHVALSEHWRGSTSFQTKAFYAEDVYSAPCYQQVVPVESFYVQ